MADTNAPVEAKVKVGTAATLVTALVTGLLATYVFHGVTPDFVNEGISAIVTGGVGFIAMWLTKHTPRNIVDLTVDDSKPPTAFEPNMTSGPIGVEPTDPASPNAP